MNRGFLTIVLVILALTAFAANSVLGRLALQIGGTGAEIGPYSYTLIRFVSGAIVLALILGVKSSLMSGSWRGALSLVFYGVFFSFAYLLLSAGTGALILFAAVQLSMLGYGFFKGERLSPLQWLGFSMALCGLVYLLMPGLQTPSLIGSLLMIIAGLGWGAYSILGKAAGNPMAQTAGNFIRAALILLGLSLPVLGIIPETLPTFKGWGLAVTSGVVTSALGYAIWYKALKHISVTQAGLSQLCVPALAALGGVLFINEPVTLRFIIASLIILGGVCLSTLYRVPLPKAPQ